MRSCLETFPTIPHTSPLVSLCWLCSSWAGASPLLPHSRVFCRIIHVYSCFIACAHVPNAQLSWFKPFWYDNFLRCWPGSSPTVLSRFVALVCRTHSTHCVVLQVVVLLVLLPLVLPRRLLTMRPLKRAAQFLQCSFSRLPSALRALLLSVLYMQVSCASRCACVWPARCVCVPVFGLIVLCVDLASQTLTLGLCDVPQPLAAAVA
jgi:hypothetical protein